MAYPKIPLELRFWSRVQLGPKCWTWQGAKDKDGYGIIALDNWQTAKKAHRISHGLSFGEPNVDFMVCHHCDNPSCVRPGHLYLGTAQDNALDRSKRGRQQDQRGEKNPHAVLTASKVRRIRRLKSKGIWIAEIARRVDVPAANVHHVFHNKTWRHVS